VNLNGGEHTGAQLGVLNGVRKEIHGLQLGALNYAERTQAVQLGAGNLVEEGAGVQIGALDYADSSFSGVQAGVVNVVGRKMKGVQIGVVNRADELKGLQLGLLNIAGRGGFLPVSPILNAGF
jgi:hypothetical protein